MPILKERIDHRVYFAGEHVSSMPAWTEGALLSAHRVLMYLQEEPFDVVIIGGTSLALLTAIELAKRQPTWRIVLVEQRSILNGTCSNEFEQASSSDARGYLHIESNTTDGDLNAVDLMARYPFQALSDPYRAKFDVGVSFLNQTDSIIDLLDVIRQGDIYSNVTIRENEQFLNYTHARVFTNRGTMLVRQKILFLDNCRVEDYVSRVLGKLHVNVQFEELPCVSFSQRANMSLPTWQVDQQLLGFDDNKARRRHIIVLNSDVSQALGWLRRHASSLLDPDDYVWNKVYKRTSLIDRGHIIDYIPDSANRSILFIGRTDVDLFPEWARLLTNLTLNDRQPNISKYSIALSNRLVASNYASSWASTSVTMCFLRLLFHVTMP